ncbi:hypothetical protein E1301_Tti009073 [Triplophysa tibetana]|uniref:Uncharacterized protein n=1 Tax=Triplophysa tibetana TaxID=1572043 RepID=A0A5A9PMF8_9TELE|nr:hypothetical protein E1301_Tti009073 [Triplophysa tibetana]
MLTLSPPPAGVLSFVVPCGGPGASVDGSTVLPLAAGGGSFFGGKSGRVPRPLLLPLGRTDAGSVPMAGGGRTRGNSPAPAWTIATPPRLRGAAAKVAVPGLALRTLRDSEATLRRGLSDSMSLLRPEFRHRCNEVSSRLSHSLRRSFVYPPPVCPRFPSIPSSLHPWHGILFSRVQLEFHCLALDRCGSAQCRAGDVHEADVQSQSGDVSGIEMLTPVWETCYRRQPTDG